MNEGKGDMIRLAIAYRNGSINDKILDDICKENNWKYKKDNKFGVLIFPNILD